MRMRHVAMAAAMAVGAVACTPPPPPSGSANAPRLQITPAASGLPDQPWDIAWTPDRRQLITLKSQGLWINDAGGFRRLTTGGPDFVSAGETGMMGLAVHPGFGRTNRRVYTCQGSRRNGNTVEVLGWDVNAAYTQATLVQNPLVGGIDMTSGRHGGCRLEFDQVGRLLITTGDAAVGAYPQSLRSLNGKVLRVNASTGAAAAGNPFIGRAGIDPRIVSYGHRNPQGLAIRSNGQVWTSEHGPDRDDEINWIGAGLNYGWNPVPGYNESVPMTFAGATPAKWRSGVPTHAVSGMTFLSGARWKGWNGALVVAELKAQRLMIASFDPANGNLAGTIFPAEFNRRFGRLRTAQQGPDGCLYVLAPNQVLRACPV
jgi:glucose/arabinose dehydrogenase